MAKFGDTLPRTASCLSQTLDDKWSPNKSAQAMPLNYTFYFK